jgi:hypothetical protein
MDSPDASLLASDQWDNFIRECGEPGDSVVSLDTDVVSVIASEGEVPHSTRALPKQSHGRGMYPPLHLPSPVPPTPPQLFSACFSYAASSPAQAKTCTS